MNHKKLVRKYMRLAKQVGEDQNPCYSRQIGVIIIDPETQRVLGTGYNGPAPKTPHCDSKEFLRDYFWPQLTEDEKTSFRLELNLPKETEDSKICNEFLFKYQGCKVCPRRLIKAGPGQRSELCSCGHAERHAITNAAQPLKNTVMFCWCGIPCLQCSDAIIQARIQLIYCIKEVSDYHPTSRKLLEWGGVGVMEYEKDWLLSDD